MIITYDSTNSRYDKTWQEAVDAFNSGKAVVIKDLSDIEDPNSNVTVWYLLKILPNDDGAADEYKYQLIFGTLTGLPQSPTSSMFMIASATPTDYLTNVTIG